MPKKKKNCNEREKNYPFHPEGHQCPTKFSLNYVTYGKDSLEIVSTPPEGWQSPSWIFLSQVGYLVGMKGLNQNLVIGIFF